MPDGPILVTSAAGFIGFHVAQRLLRNGCNVVGLDNMNAYCDPALKESRLAQLAKSNRLGFVKLDLADREGLASSFKKAPLSLCGSCRQPSRIVAKPVGLASTYVMDEDDAYNKWRQPLCARRSLLANADPQPEPRGALCFRYMGLARGWRVRRGHFRATPGAA